MLSNKDFIGMLGSKDLEKKKERFDLKQIEQMDRQNKAKYLSKSQKSKRGDEDAENEDYTQPSSAGKEKKDEKYRDRAQERRATDTQQQNDENRLFDEVVKSLDAEQTKFLGGDVAHTHLVKGLDYALLQKNRLLEKQEREQQKVDTVAAASATDVVSASSSSNDDASVHRALQLQVLKQFPAVPKNDADSGGNAPERSNTSSSSSATTSFGGKVISTKPSDTSITKATKPKASFSSIIYEYNMNDDSSTALLSSDLPTTVVKGVEDTGAVDDDPYINLPLESNLINRIKETLSQSSHKKSSGAGGKAVPLPVKAAARIAPKVAAKAMPKGPSMSMFDDGDDDIFGGLGKYIPAGTSASPTSASKAAEVPGTESNVKVVDLSAEGGAYASSAVTSVKGLFHQLGGATVGGETALDEEPAKVSTNNMIKNLVAKETSFDAQPAPAFLSQKTVTKASKQMAVTYTEDGKETVNRDVFGFIPGATTKSKHHQGESMIGFSSKNKGFQDENEDELMTRNIEGHLDYYEENSDAEGDYGYGDEDEGGHKTTVKGQGKRSANGCEDKVDKGEKAVFHKKRRLQSGQSGAGPKNRAERRASGQQ